MNESGHSGETEVLLEELYGELRRLAAAKLARERPGQTLQATALVHEVYLRLSGGSGGHVWDDRGHFFAAAAEAMRRILIEGARRRQSQKRGGAIKREDLVESAICAPAPDEEVLAVDEALGRFEQVDPEGAKLVKLRYFAGLSAQEAAAALGIPVRTANRRWAYARAWLFRDLSR